MICCNTPKFELVYKVLYVHCVCLSSHFALCLLPLLSPLLVVGAVTRRAAETVMRHPQTLLSSTGTVSHSVSVFVSPTHTFTYCMMDCVDLFEWRRVTGCFDDLLSLLK